MAKNNTGFTSIAVLVLTILISMLALVLVAVINPTEQAKKSSDTQKKTEAQELLRAYESYFSSYGCYPWAGGAGVACGTDEQVTALAFNPNFNDGGDSEGLIIAKKIKEEFKGKDSVRNRDNKKRLWVAEAVAGVISVCFEPESNPARNGEFGRLRNQLNTQDQPCQTNFYPDESCFLCVPE